MHFLLSILQKKLMGFESRIFISAEQFAMSRSSSPSRGATAGSGNSKPDLSCSLSPGRGGRGGDAASNSWRPSGKRNWADLDDEHQQQSLLSSSIRGDGGRRGRGGRGGRNTPFNEDKTKPSTDEDETDEDETEPSTDEESLENDTSSDEEDDDDKEDIEKMLQLLQDHLAGIADLANLIFTMNALFLMQSLLDQANFEKRDILRFFRLLIKIFSPEPPKRASVPRRPKEKSRVPEGSTCRFEIMMRIWHHTGVRDFVCDAQKVIRGIFLSTANPMLVSSIITAINAIEQFSDPIMKRMCLFLIALASGISCDSPVVRSPKLLAEFFDNVYNVISEGMQEGAVNFDRDTVLPAKNFLQEFADEAWRILNYVDNMFAKVPNSPAESSAGKKAVSKKPQGAAEGGKQAAKKSAGYNPFEGFDADIVDDASILTNACSAINPADLPVFMQHIFHCFYHALDLVEKDTKNIMGNITKHSLKFALLSLLHSPMQPIPAIAFTQFSSLLSMISNVSVSKFKINHVRSADFLSKLACLVRLLRPEGDQAEALLKTWFAEDMQQFVSGNNLSSVMHELYVLFREQLLDDKRRVLDKTFTDVFPDVKLSDATTKLPKSNERVKFRAMGGGVAAANESIAVQCRDVDLRQFQEFKRNQAAFEQWQKEKTDAKGKKK